MRTQTLLRLSLLLFIFCSTAFSQDSIQLDFERIEGFEWGMIDVSQSEFTSTNSKINDVDAVSGNQVLLLGNRSEAGSFILRCASIADSAIGYVDFHIKVARTKAVSQFFPLVSSPFRIDYSSPGVPGQNAGLSFSSEDGSIGIESITKVDDWNRFTVRLDVEQKKFDLYINGVFAFRDEGFPEKVSKENPLYLKLDSIEGVSLVLDKLYVGTENPLFDDSDNDGIDDRYELEHGMDITIDDRNGDLDGDGISNIDEFLYGTHPTFADNPFLTDQEYWYVDNDRGWDGNDGRSLLPCLYGNGPLKTIQSALKVSSDGDTIIILSGIEPYHLNTFELEGKQVRIIPFGKVEIDSNSN